MTDTTPIDMQGTHQKRAARLVRPKDALRHGFYTQLFSAEEIRLLDACTATIQDEKNLLRIKIRRLAKLIPLKKIDAKELEALIKLIRVVAVLDALERTGITARKVDGSGGSPLDALDEMDPDEIEE